jgi:RNA polymerase sigma-70 factor, ECF subfamily
VAKTVTQTLRPGLPRSGKIFLPCEAFLAFLFAPRRKTMQATLTLSGPQGNRLLSYRSLERCSVEELLSRSQQGELAARHALVGRYQSIIHATANRMASTRHDAEDLATDIYLHVFSVINSCKNIQTLPGWIKRVATNEVYQAWRRKSRQPAQTSLESVVEAGGDSILRADESTNPAVILMERSRQEERSARLQTALLSLPAHHRVLCDLHYVQEKSFEQISKETGLPLGTIKSRLFRAREAMQRKLGDLAYA